MIKKFTSFVILFLLFLIILGVFTYPLTTKITEHIYGPIWETDNRATIRDFWFAKYAFVNKLDFHNNTFVNFPFGPSIKNYSLLPFWLTPRCLFSALANEIFAYNFLILCSFVLSFLGMYLLVFYLTGNHLCSFISGILYSFCPYHFNKAWEHYSLIFIDFLPFSILYLLKVKDKPGIKNMIVCSIFLTLVIVSDLSYAYIISVGVAFYFLYTVYYISTRHRPLKDTFLITKNLIVVGVFTLIIVSPAIFPVIKQMFFTPRTDAVMQEVFIRPIKYLFQQSARPLNYIMPASSHPLFGKFTKSMFGSIFYGRNSIEHTLYLGWAAIILSFLAFRKYRRKPNTLGSKENFAIGLFVFLSITAFLFSMPPYINLGLFKIYFPGFFMYKILPMFRAYARFGILLMLCVSVLAGFGIKFVLEKCKSRGKRIIFTSIILIIILFEFNNIPPFRVTDLDAKIPEVYRWLADKKEDFPIIEYPLGEGGVGEEYKNLNYLFYQRVHHKKLINGAMPGTYAFEIKKKIRKITDLQTPGILKWLGAKYAVIHLDIYRQTSSRQAMEIIGEVPNLRRLQGFKFVSEFDDAEVYEIIAEAIEPKTKEDFFGGRSKHSNSKNVN